MIPHQLTRWHGWTTAIQACILSEKRWSASMRPGALSDNRGKRIWLRSCISLQKVSHVHPVVSRRGISQSKSVAERDWMMNFAPNNYGCHKAERIKDPESFSRRVMLRIGYPFGTGTHQRLDPNIAKYKQQTKTLFSRSTLKPNLTPDRSSFGN